MGAIPLVGCKTDLYPHTLLLDEIYKKEYPLRIVRREGDLFEGQSTFYLYAATASEKEDWLFALRQACSAKDQECVAQEGSIPDDQAKTSSGSSSPISDPKILDAIFMERLNRYVRASTMDKSTQWINAITGRLFFNMFRSNDLERFFRKKFERKAATAPKPFFVGDLILKSVFAGQSLPMFSRGQLHSVTNQGELLVSVDVFYPGGFRMQIETEIRWDIPKVKTIIVPVVMSIHVRRMSGRALLRIKPPPSDRLWIGFYAPPLLEIDIEPVVSSKALTWSVIKMGIMKHIHDTMAEFIVLPNMDDLTIPPLIIGDCYGGEKPFELDYLPPSLIQEARKLDYSAKGISAMRSSRSDMRTPEENANGDRNYVNGILHRALIEGSRSLSDLSMEADLSMDPLSSVSPSSAAPSSFSNSTASRSKPAQQILDEARDSDMRAREYISRDKVVLGSGREGNPASDSEAGRSQNSSTASSPNRTTREVLSNVKRSVSSFFKTQVTHIRSEIAERHHNHRQRRHTDGLEINDPNPDPLFEKKGIREHHE